MISLRSPESTNCRRKAEAIKLVRDEKESREYKTRKLTNNFKDGPSESSLGRIPSPSLCPGATASTVNPGPLQSTRA
jgi:hypothetical protein